MEYDWQWQHFCWKEIPLIVFYILSVTMWRPQYTKSYIWSIPDYSVNQTFCTGRISIPLVRSNVYIFSLNINQEHVLLLKLLCKIFKSYSTEILSIDGLFYHKLFHLFYTYMTVRRWFQINAHISNAIVSEQTYTAMCLSEDLTRGHSQQCLSPWVAVVRWLVGLQGEARLLVEGKF